MLFRTSPATRVVFAALVLTACSSDDDRGPRGDGAVIGVDGGGPGTDASAIDGGPRPDGAPIEDGGSGIDASEPIDAGPRIDAGPTTPCGDGVCQRATEVCVSGSFGGPSIIGCRSVPAGCESDRTCACLAATYCNTGLAICADVSENHIDCDTGLD